MEPKNDSPGCSLAVLSLGSNLGDRAGFLAAGIRGLAASCGDVVAQSAFYESAVWGGTDQADYLNVAVVLRTGLLPEVLLCCCQEIERANGRERSGKWAARTLDIDILFYGEQVIELPHLCIPHPLLQERRFVLQPLAEVLPHFPHPVLGGTVAELLTRCPDSGRVVRWLP